MYQDIKVSVEKVFIQYLFIKIIEGKYQMGFQFIFINGIIDL